MAVAPSLAGERPRIRVLPPEVAARIAAGEVIERPASIVKELVENALDAGARRIEVSLEGGGVDVIRVRDDGHGIPPDQLPDAFERHATSKLRVAEDLFAVQTLGFRGEALAAIVAAADVDFTTRPPLEDAAAVARFRGGRATGGGAAAAAPGSTVEVRDLFASLPARRRFLREGRAEARAVAAVVTDWAVARPDVAFRLASEGRTLLATPGDGALASAFAAIHGPDLGGGLLPLEGTRSGEDGARVAVSGAVAPPEAHRANRRALHLVVNRRAVTSRTLLASIEQAYAGLLPAGRHPAGVVHIEVPADQVDVNVHPQKAEVRLRHERFVAGAVHGAVRRALLDAAARTYGGLEGWRPSAVTADSLPGARPVIEAARPASELPRAASLAALEEPPPDLAAPGAAVSAPPAVTRALPPLRPLGQLDATYLVAEAADGLFVIDQHAAHERVHYERLLEARTAGRVESQALLEVAVAPLAATAVLLALTHREALVALGWELEETDGAALLVRAVPVALAGRDAARVLAEYLDQLEAEGRRATADAAVAALACKAAVRAGDRLDLPQQRALLEALER
ncbi:MAG: DNA mismatch repair endonuclease MutL, partial [Dehalococcoidia bacterium]|nr:DNA mismatch repair endonuclease MutL [Dehalococcoidia bacterium]